MNARVRSQDFSRAPLRPRPAGVHPPAQSELRAGLDQELLKTETIDQLNLVMANVLRARVCAQQVFVFSNRPAPQVVAISSMQQANRQSPLVQDLEQVVRVLFSAGELAAPRMLTLGAETIDFAPHLKAYPFRHLVWTPFIGADDSSSGGILYARKDCWQDENVTDLAGCAQLFSQRLEALEPRGPPDGKSVKWLKSANRSKTGLIAGILVLLALCTPTTMSVSAPFQVVSRDHLVISAPIEGVVEDILVMPGEYVSVGQPLVKFVDTERQNQVSIALREVDLSEAVLKRASQLSFEDEDGRRQLGPSMADVAIKRAELKLAQDQSSRATIIAKSAGIAVFSDEKSLTGRPFSIGERILDISNPDQIEFEIGLDLSDAIAMEKGATVKLFPDASPMSSFNANLTRISYLAEPDQTGRLTYRLVAEPDQAINPVPKLGTSGTAKIYGRTVPLAFYLFRRPITAARQWLGV